MNLPDHLRGPALSHNVTALPAGKPRGNALARLVAQRAHRIVGAVHVASRHGQVLVPQQVAHEKGIGAALSGIGADVWRRIVQPNVVKSGSGSDFVPCRLDPGFGERMLSVER